MSKELIKRKRRTDGEGTSPKRRLSSSSEDVPNSLQKTEASVSPSVLSLKSDMSKGIFTTFKTDQKGLQKTEASVSPSVQSLASNSSKDINIDFKSDEKGSQEAKKPRHVSTTSTSSMLVDEPMTFPESARLKRIRAVSTSSMFEPMAFSTSRSVRIRAASTSSMFEPMAFPKSSEKTVVSNNPRRMSLRSNVSTESSVFDRQDSQRLLECCVCKDPCEDVSALMLCGHLACTRCVTETQSLSLYHCYVCGTFRTKETNKSHTLSQVRLDISQKLKDEMVDKYSMSTEGNGDGKIPLNHIYTSVSVTSANSGILEEHYLSQMFKKKKPNSQSQDQDVEISNLFESLSTKSPRTVLTNGIAGIGKSFYVQKFIVDWAEGVSYQDVYFVFSLSFRELNLIKQDISLLDLLKVFHPGVTDLNSKVLDLCKVIVILDGFDESRFNLDFIDSQTLSSVQEPASVSKLLINLIKGNLLPDAQLWITSRPAASYLIPAEFIHKVTEIQGFNDQQKKEYFNKRFSHKPEVAKMVITYTQSSQTLDLLCQIPIFCWMCSVLLEEVFEGEEQTKGPQTLTEMMGSFLFIQMKRSSRKYDQNPDIECIRLLTAKRGFLLKLGKLAFIHLLKRSLIFYHEDLQQCGLDPEEVTVKSGFFNSVLRQDQLFSQQKVFYFVHLTIQEFFAAVYVHDCFTNNRDWAEELSTFLDLESSESFSRPPLIDLLKMVIDKVLETNSGHLYFFQRFLLGLMVESNQKVLHGLLNPQRSDQDTAKNMLIYLKAIRRKTISPDACINLFQTMVEMGDSKINEDIQEYLKNTDPAQITLTPLHCSALAFTIQSSKSALEVFDLKSYNTSDEGRRRLMPAIRSSKKANLSECRMSEALLKPLSLALSFPHSSLRDLDLTNSDLGDFGVKFLSEGLKSPVCKLRIFRLSGCLVTDIGCNSLVSALKSNPSHLKELDLSYNNLTTSGETSLRDLIIDPQYNLQHLQLNLSHGGSNRMILGLKKYWFDLSWDTKQVCAGLQLSDKNRKVSRSEETPDRVLVWGGQSLSDRCYWEIEAPEPFNVGVASQSKEPRPGQKETSWTFACSEEGCYAFRNNQRFPVTSAHCSRLSRLAVYLDIPAGVLSFYRVSTDSRSCLYTFRENFTNDLFPVAELKKKSYVKFYCESTKSEQHRT